jgi:hypothetical protein
MHKTKNTTVGKPAYCILMEKHGYLKSMVGDRFLYIKRQDDKMKGSEWDTPIQRTHFPNAFTAIVLTILVISFIADTSVTKLITILILLHKGIYHFFFFFLHFVKIYTVSTKFSK